MRRHHQPGRHRHQHRRGEGRRPGRGHLGRALIEAVARAAARALEERYGLEDPELGARLEGGFANDLFRARAGGREWVLRLQLPPVDEAGLAWEHAVTARLAQHVPEVCAPVAARDGATWFPAGDTVAWLVPLQRHNLRALAALARTGRATRTRVQNAHGR